MRSCEISLQFLGDSELKGRKRLHDPARSTTSHHTSRLFKPLIPGRLRSLFGRMITQISGGVAGASTAKLSTTRGQRDRSSALDRRDHQKKVAMSILKWGWRIRR
jgi:hypothetical protein